MGVANHRHAFPQTLHLPETAEVLRKLVRRHSLRVIGSPAGRGLEAALGDRLPQVGMALKDRLESRQIRDCEEDGVEGRKEDDGPICSGPGRW